MSRPYKDKTEKKQIGQNLCFDTFWPIIIIGYEE